MDISTASGAREIKQRYFNDTVYTIGYEGRDWDEFLSLLQETEFHKGCPETLGPLLSEK